MTYVCPFCNKEYDESLAAQGPRTESRKAWLCPDGHPMEKLGTFGGGVSSAILYLISFGILVNIGTSAFGLGVVAVYLHLILAIVAGGGALYYRSGTPDLFWHNCSDEQAL